MKRFGFFIWVLGVCFAGAGYTTDSLADSDSGEWEAPPEKKFTAKQKKAECRKYNGNYVSYYSRLFWVEDCKLREVVKKDLVRRISETYQRKISEINADTLIMLKSGSEIVRLPGKSVSRINRKCSQLEKQYVTVDLVELYFISGCRARLFPDWETYVEHRKKRKQLDKPLLELGQAEMDGVKKGRPYPSILDVEFEKLYDGGRSVELIPLSEACKGLNGKYVSYYSRIYKIEKCRKREIDAASFLKSNKRLKLSELSGDQWFSLPDGEPWGK